MPTYDYVCKKCRNRFEEVQPFSAEPVAKCPKCGNNAERQFSVPVVVYKGSGFYTTDHGRSSGNGASKKSETADSGDKAKAEKPSAEKSEKKSDSKPDSGKAAAAKSSSTSG
jgi:putative FmdB family regulatory protein